MGTSATQERGIIWVKKACDAFQRIRLSQAICASGGARRIPGVLRCGGIPLGCQDSMRFGGGLGTYGAYGMEVTSVNGDQTIQ